MNTKGNVRWKIALAFIAIGLLLTAAVATATTVVPLELPQMVDRSELIVVGRSVQAESVWVGRTLFTRYTVEVEETLDGEVRTSVQVLVPGGVDRKRKIAMSAAGAPMFMPEERSVLLLRRLTSRSEFGVVGFNQGKFRVTGDVAEARSLTSGRSGTVPMVELRERLQALARNRGAPPDATRASRKLP